jgi:hypothetical protein
MSLTDKMSNLTLSQSNNWKENIVIGSRIKLIDNDNEYIFYGYNHDKSIICCFPTNSSSIYEDNLYSLTKNIEKLL